VADAVIEAILFNLKLIENPWEESARFYFFIARLASLELPQ